MGDSKMSTTDFVKELKQLVEAFRSSEQRQQVPVKRFLSVKNAALYCDLSEESLRRLCKQGKLTELRPVGGRIIIDRMELDAFILSCSETPRKGRGRHCSQTKSLERRSRFKNSPKLPSGMVKRGRSYYSRFSTRWEIDSQNVEPQFSGCQKDAH